MISCQEPNNMNLRNKEQNPPEKFFEGSQLVCAQKIFDNNIQELKNILEKNPELLNKLSDKKGYTLLMYSSILENLEAMKLLLKKGADPNIIIPYLNNSPLSQAVASNNYQMLNLLLKYKTSLNPSVGKSPLVVALMIEGEDNEKKMIDYLLKNCANINHSSYLGHNIMESAARDHIETAKIFIKKGGNPIIRNTKISPIAEFMTWKEKEISKHKSINEKYKNKFFSLKKNSTEPI